MKYLPLICSGIWRKPGRTLLTFLQICVAFALFGVLQGMKTAVDQAIAHLSADLLIVHSRHAFGGPMALAGLERIKSVPGVKLVVPQSAFYATYQIPTQGVFVGAADFDNAWLEANPDLKVAPEYMEAFHNTRTGALVNVKLAEKYGWKVGDRIPLISTIRQSNGSTDWAFDVVGTFRDNELGSNDFMLIHYSYFDEARLVENGTVRLFMVAVSDPKQVALISDEIDRRFANSPNETRTESLRELSQAQMQSIGDLNFLIRAIVSAVLVALLFSTSTMMMQSIRERTPELAVLKTLGFTGRAVFVLILAEAMAICITAAALGLALAALVFPVTAKMVPGLSMPMIVVEGGLFCAVWVALISVALPAARAAKLNVATALAGR
jgi:putative ABC transport system permease protein